MLCPFIHSSIHSLLHSFRSLPYDRSIISSKASSPQSAIQCFLFEFPISSLVLKIILQLLMSSFSSSRHFYPSLHLSFNIVLQKAVTMPKVTNPFTLLSFYCLQDISLLPDFCNINMSINPLKPELNPICYLLALLGAHHFLHVSRIRVKLLTLR